MNYPPGGHKCSFCGKSHDEVERLIAGPDNVFICNYCVELCHNLLADEDYTETNVPDFQLERLLTPREIMDHLDEYVVGQEKIQQQ